MIPILQTTDPFTFWIIMGLCLIFVVVIYVVGGNNEREEQEKEKKWEEERKIEEEKEDLRQKKVAKEVKDSNLWKADERISEMLDKVSDEVFICDKCKSNRFRVWDLSETYLQVRCLGCKKNHGYQLTSIDKIKDFFSLYTDYQKLDRYSYNNYLPAIIDIYDKRLPSQSNFETYRQIFIEGQRSLDDKNVNSSEKRSRRISQDVRDKVWRRDEGKCIECGSNENLEFDHIIPFSEGGANTYRNIQLLCEPCNRKKSAKIG